MQDRKPQPFVNRPGASAAVAIVCPPLDRHTTELLGLYRCGNTAAELQRWLRDKKRIKVTLSTVTRWLARQYHGQVCRCPPTGCSSDEKPSG